MYCVGRVGGYDSYYPYYIYAKGVFWQYVRNKNIYEGFSFSFCIIGEFFMELTRGAHAPIVEELSVAVVPLDFALVGVCATHSDMGIACPPAISVCLLLIVK